MRKRAPQSCPAHRCGPHPYDEAVGRNKKSLKENASMQRLRAMCIALTSCVLAAPSSALAHAILVRSQPADNATLNTHAVTLVLDYNSRIDAPRCTVQLVGPGNRSFPLVMQASGKPWELKANASGLANGTYHLHWQVLASDGHITRGNISFSVAAK